MLLCPGGRFDAMNGRYYVCATRRNGGTAACSNPLSLRIDVLDDDVLRLLEGQALHPAFIEQVLNLACGNGGHDGRPQLEAKRDALTEAIGRLLALAEAGAGDVAEVAANLKQRTAEREALNPRLAALAEPPDRAKLKWPRTALRRLARPSAVSASRRSAVRDSAAHRAVAAAAIASRGTRSV
jgi:hypothetical protein